MVRPRDTKAKNNLNGVELGTGLAPIKDQVAFYDLFWNAWHERYRRQIGFFYHFDEKSRISLLDWALNRFIGVGNQRRAFDLGCGRGRLARALHHRGWSTGGIDLSEATIAQIAKENPDIEFKAGDMFAYDGYDWGSYDLVTSSEVMEHIQIDKREAYVEIIHRLLKDKGIALITTPNMLEMKRLGWSPEQPLDFWMTPNELRSYFEDKFDILAFRTASYCLKNRIMNRLWKLIPFANRITDRLISTTELGKYQLLVVRKR